MQRDNARDEAHQKRGADAARARRVDVLLGVVDEEDVRRRPAVLGREGRDEVRLDVPDAPQFARVLAEDARRVEVPQQPDTAQLRHDGPLVPDRDDAELAQRTEQRVERRDPRRAAEVGHQFLGPHRREQLGLVGDRPRAGALEKYRRRQRALRRGWSSYFGAPLKPSLRVDVIHINRALATHIEVQDDDGGRWAPIGPGDARLRAAWVLHQKRGADAARARRVDVLLGVVDEEDVRRRPAVLGREGRDEVRLDVPDAPQFARVLAEDARRVEVPQQPDTAQLRHDGPLVPDRDDAELAQRTEQRVERRDPRRAAEVGHQFLGPHRREQLGLVGDRPRAGALEKYRRRQRAIEVQDDDARPLGPHRSRGCEASSCVGSAGCARRPRQV
eukprot:CAMPEP_0185721028 /NCGR_PEP_ID=MMETSP1164-20130828/50411_1 /TAXON_ID=1104430 /ORGANISM="Chrysoreinhardia sp, Strain CCMP2950" /LENGTH=387 /DNA_ID=CAMNT_0028388689 /DNA_START=76 /DNA_END=1237 /DNA_ORIENTATION=+